MHTDYKKVYDEISSLEQSGDSHITTTISSLDADQLQNSMTKLDPTQRGITAMFSCISGDLCGMVKMLHTRRQMDKWAIETLSKQLSIAYINNYASSSSSSVANRSKHIQHSKFISDLNERKEHLEMLKVKEKMRKEIEEEMRKVEDQMANLRVSPVEPVGPAPVDHPMDL
jgi:hypothetical protein